MSPFTSAQQAFLEQMRLNNTDERAMRIIEAAFNARNEMSAGADHDLVTVCDKVAG
jgi:hypothetical protein